MANQQGISFTITADTADAAAKLNDFFSKTTQSMTTLSGLGELLSGIGSKIAAAVTVGSLVEFTREAINTAESMGRMAQQSGLAITTLSAFREEAIKLGTPLELLQMSLGLFADKVYNAVRMGGQAAQVFRDLGVKLVDANGNMRSTDDILAGVADRFKAMPDGPQKAANAMQLFGRSGRDLIPILNEGAAGIERMRQEGGPISAQMVADATEFNRSVRVLVEGFDDLFLKLARDVLPSLKSFVSYLKDGELAIGLGKFSEFFELSMKAAITDVGDFLLKQIDTWSEKLAKVIPGAGGGSGLLAKIGYGAAGLGVGALGLWDMAGAAVGVPGAAQGADLRQGQADSLFAKAGLGGGMISDMVDEKLSSAFAKAIGNVFGASSGAAPQNPYRAQLDELRGSMHTQAGGQKAFQDVVGWGQAIGGAISGLPGLLLGGGGGGTGNKAPLSETAKKMLADVEKAFQEATQSKVAQLNEEEKQLKAKIDLEVQDVTKAEAAKTEVTQLYASKRKEVLDKEQAAQLEIALAKVQGQRSLLEKDPTVTEAAKQEKLLDLLRQENVLLEKNIALQQKRLLDPSLSDEAHLTASKQLQDLSQRHAETTRQIDTTQRQGNFGGQFKGVLTDLGNQWGTWASQTANAFKSVFNSAISSISSGITSLIMGTKTWGQALMDIGTSILTNIVQAIIEMGVRWVLTQLTMAVAGKAIAASNVAALAPIAAAQSAVWAAPAALATIASYGGAAASAPGLVAAAVAFTQAESAAEFEEGGFTGGREGQVAGIVHGGEFVFNAPATRKLGVGPLTALQQAATGKGGVSSGGKPGRVVIVSDERRLRDMSNDAGFESMVVRINQRNRWRYQA